MYLDKLSSNATIAVLTGAGMSAESGIPTFRDSNGLWENHKIEDVATFEAWQRDPQFVLEFYNERRKNVINSKPNAGHLALARLQEVLDVQIITQNIDDLHERAGSKHVLHLHGEILKARSTVDDQLLYPIEGMRIEMGDTCEKGSQLRPHVVWFGEEVPMLATATELVVRADLLVVVGTSLQVYPAANLIYETRRGTPIIFIDPADLPVQTSAQLTHLKMKASEGLEWLYQELVR